MSEDTNSSRKNRPGAGRKVGTGKFGETTTVLRVPISQKGIIVDYLEAVRSGLKRRPIGGMPEMLAPAEHPSHVMLNLYSSKIAAGLPNPVDDHIDDQIDINSFLIEHKGDTFIAPVASDSLKDLGVIRNHYVVINKSLQPKQGDVIAAVVDNGFTIKILSRTQDGRPLLKKANPDPQYHDIEIKEGMDFEVWGVVTGTFAKL
jgi:DNA polymerase V